MSIFYEIFAASALLLINCTTLSAQPSWEVVPANYQYTMTMAGVAVFDCMESDDENDLVAAFVNNEVRGVQHLDTDFMGRKFAYMIIYDNEFSGSEITFKLYDASENEVRDAVGSVEFLENSNIGDVDNPYEVKTDYGIQDLFLTTDSIQHDATAGTALATIIAVNENQDTISPTFAFVNDALGPDNDYFSILDSLLVLTEDVDASMKTTYQIHLSATNQNGCSLDVVFVLPVTGVVSDIQDGSLENYKNDLTIYPNPTSNMLHFATENSIDRVNIHSSNGKLVKRISELNGKKTIDISGLAPGLYWVTCQMKHLTFTHKLMVQH